MITGAHAIVSSTDPDADRAFLRDVLELPHVDAGGGWPIFALPPAELAVHPSARNDQHELYLMCADVDAFVARLAQRGVACDPVRAADWGRLTRIALPGGGTLGVYEPRHPRPEAERGTGEVRLRAHLASPPEAVFALLATDAGRRRFWAESADERDGVVRFRFANGLEHAGRVLEARPARRFAVEYFGGSRAAFELEGDGAGGTDVTLVETGVPRAWLHEHRAGWISVLLALKAAADFSVDLRNPDPRRSWERGYVDV